jgi:hypothetical protein
MSTSRGRISEKAGTRRTSSNVKPSMNCLAGLLFVAMGKDRERELFIEKPEVGIRSKGFVIRYS